MCDIPIIASSSDFFGFRVFDVLVPLPISTLKRTPFVQNMTDEFFPPFDSRRILYPTVSPTASPLSAEIRSATEIADIRRG